MDAGLSSLEGHEVGQHLLKLGQVRSPAQVRPPLRIPEPLPHGLPEGIEGWQVGRKFKGTAAGEPVLDVTGDVE